jgi:hypothetical protein
MWEREDNAHASEQLRRLRSRGKYWRTDTMFCP